MKNNKTMNAMAAEYKSLKEQMKEIEKRVTEIGEIFKKTGSMETADFVISVDNVSREQLAGLGKVEEAFSREALDKLGLINTVSYKVIKITEKGE